MRKIKSVILGTIVLFLFICDTANVAAWSQEAHMQINTEAVGAFSNNYSSTEKYTDSPIDWNKQINGPAVIESGLMESTYGYKDMTVADWVAHGGYSADEPNFYASLRHFFDPLKVSGKYYLTDMPYDWVETVANAVVNPEIDARWWALSHEDNAFSFKKGLEYYKDSMEVMVGLTDDGGFNVVSKNFREGEGKTFTEDDELRDYYLAKAFRALGETMHLIGDMTQPAHVRNDEHKNGDPIEDSVNKATVMNWASGKPASSVVFPSSPKQLFYNIAAFTNSNFYSNDTIYDANTGVMPNNGLNPYPSPQFSNMSREKGNIKYLDADGTEVPMVARTLSSYIYGVDDEESYMIPVSFTQLQAKVLIPVAIKGCETLMNGFLPTLSLDLSYESALAAVNGKGNINAYRLKSELIHHVDRDPVWSEYGMQVKYSGEAEIVRKSENRQAEILAYAQYLDGRLIGWKLGKDNDYKLVEPVITVLDDGTASTDQYIVIGSKDELYLQTSAGGRILASNIISFKSPQMLVDPESESIEEGTELQFDLKLENGPQNPRFKWSFGDGTSDVQGDQLSISHVFKKVGENYVTVILFDEKDNSTPLAQAHARVTVLQKESEPDIDKHEDKPSPKADPDPKPEPDPKPKPTSAKPTVEEYDYQAALAAWAADLAAEVNSRVYDDGVCKSTTEFEWVMQPVIRDGQVIGASRIWQTNTFYDGENKGKTWRGTVNEAYDSANPGFYISLGDLKEKYPQFKRTSP